MSYYDSEVLFPPHSKFKVTNWYRGDVIALGQANIREHTFKLEQHDIDRLIESDKRLIICLEEIN